MRFWMAAVALAACLPLAGSAVGTLLVRALGLPAVFLASMVFAAGSAAAYVVFWAYFIDPLAGRLAWTFVIMSNGAWLASRLWRSVRCGWRIDRDAWTPFALTACVAVACLSYLAWPGVSSPRRFSVGLPLEDHLTSQLLADRFAAGIRLEERPLAPLTTFALRLQTSDRPPLQAAAALAARPAWPIGEATRDIAYQAVAVLAQVAVLPALIAFATVLGLSRRQVGFVIVAVTCSGFFLLNAVYPWPKLYAAALLLTAFGVLAHAAHIRRLDAIRSSVIGGLAALSLLAHASPVFSLLAAPVFMALPDVRRLVDARNAAWAICAAAMLLGPWFAFQHYFDPPGTRLAKIHLAGDLEPGEGPLLSTILEAYRQTGARGWLKGRLDNIQAQLPLEWPDADPVTSAQWSIFFRQVSAIGLLAPGLAALALRRPARDTGLTLRFFVGYAAIAWLVWMLLMFRGGSAVVHHGSYATTLLLIMGGAVGLSYWGRIGSTMLALHATIFALVWLIPRAGIPVFAWQPGAGLLLVASSTTAAVLSAGWLRQEIEWSPDLSRPH